jgi:hypothetical protein
MGAVAFDAWSVRGTVIHRELEKQAWCSAPAGLPCHWGRGIISDLETDDWTWNGDHP